jgi:hypothetical protein
MLAGAVVVVATLLILSVRASRGVAPVEAAATAKEEAWQRLRRNWRASNSWNWWPTTLTSEMRARFEDHHAADAPPT